MPMMRLRGLAAVLTLSLMLSSAVPAISVSARQEADAQKFVDLPMLLVDPCDFLPRDRFEAALSATINDAVSSQPISTTFVCDYSTSTGEVITVQYVFENSLNSGSVDARLDALESGGPQTSSATYADRKGSLQTYVITQIRCGDMYLAFYVAEDQRSSWVEVGFDYPIQIGVLGGTIPEEFEIASLIADTTGTDFPVKLIEDSTVSCIGTDASIEIARTVPAQADSAMSPTPTEAATSTTSMEASTSSGLAFERLDQALQGGSTCYIVPQPQAEEILGQQFALVSAVGGQDPGRAECAYEVSLNNDDDDVFVGMAKQDGLASDLLDEGVFDEDEIASAVEDAKAAGYRYQALICGDLLVEAVTEPDGSRGELTVVFAQDYAIHIDNTSLERAIRMAAAALQNLGLSLPLELDDQGTLQCSNADEQAVAVEAEVTASPTQAAQGASPSTRPHLGLGALFSTYDNLGRLPVARMTLEPGAVLPDDFLALGFNAYVQHGAVEIDRFGVTREFGAGDSFFVRDDEDFSVTNTGVETATIIIVFHLDGDKSKESRPIPYAQPCPQYAPSDVTLDILVDYVDLTNVFDPRRFDVYEVAIPPGASWSPQDLLNQQGLPNADCFVVLDSGSVKVDGDGGWSNDAKTAWAYPDTAARFTNSKLRSATLIVVISSER